MIGLEVADGHICWASSLSPRILRMKLLVLVVVIRED